MKGVAMFLNEIQESLDQVGKHLHEKESKEAFNALWSAVQGIVVQLRSLDDQLKQMDASLYQTANTVSCLANGIRPD